MGVWSIQIVLVLSYFQQGVSGKLSLKLTGGFYHGGRHPVRVRNTWTLHQVHITTAVSIWSGTCPSACMDRTVHFGAAVIILCGIFVYPFITDTRHFIVASGRCSGRKTMGSGSVRTACQFRCDTLYTSDVAVLCRIFSIRFKYIIVDCTVVFYLVSENIIFSRLFGQILQTGIDTAEIGIFSDFHFTEVWLCGEVESYEKVGFSHTTLHIEYLHGMHYSWIILTGTRIIAINKTFDIYRLRFTYDTHVISTTRTIGDCLINSGNTSCKVDTTCRGGVWTTHIKYKIIVNEYP